MLFSLPRRLSSRRLPSLLVLLVVSLLMVTGAAGSATAGEAKAAVWSCVPYARQMSQVKTLSGDAWRWWGAAAGRFQRGQAPKPGAVMVFRKTKTMTRGHVAVVREVVNNRKILVDHANWSRDGRVEQRVAVLDVSPKNDWSQTRVWYGPIGTFGNTTYPTYGFIYPQAERAIARR